MYIYKYDSSKMIAYSDTFANEKKITAMRKRRRCLRVIAFSQYMEVINGEQ